MAKSVQEDRLEHKTVQETKESRSQHQFRIDLENIHFGDGVRDD